MSTDEKKEKPPIWEQDPPPWEKTDMDFILGLLSRRELWWLAFLKTRAWYHRGSYPNLTPVLHLKFVPSIVRDSFELDDLDVLFDGEDDGEVPS